MSRDQVLDVDQCHASGCKDRATVILRRDKKRYCRPHGLARALKLPRSSIAKLPVQEQLTA